MHQLQKSTWKQCRNRIKRANPEFYSLIEKVSPPEDLPLYIASYTYGSLLGSKKEVYIPSENGQSYLLGSSNLPNEINRDLGYGKDSFPLGIITRNNCEWFYNDHMSNRTFPYAIQGEGTIFNQQIIFDEDQTEENDAISVSSGAKSIFMLPPIGCDKHHERLKNKLNITFPAPKDPSEHFNVFNEILGNTGANKSWYSEVIFFSKSWIDKIRENSNWMIIKYFFCNKLRRKFSSNIYNSFNNDLFMGSKNVNKYRPTPFLIDTAKYIFSIATGDGIGFSPAIDESSLPLEQIQIAYNEHYKLSAIPTVMIPETIKTKFQSVYYSLQYPSKKITTFNKISEKSAYKELATLRNILVAYKEDFLRSYSENSNKILSLASKDLNLDFYHYKPSSLSSGIDNSNNIIKSDPRFLHSVSGSGKFAANAQFFRGCIRLSR